MGMLMIAKFAGACGKCGVNIDAGDQITYDRNTRSSMCERCAESSGPDLGRLFDMAYEDQCAAACGLDGQDRGN